MLYANLVSTKLRRNQFCLHNCNLRVRSSLAELCDRKILTNLLGAKGIISHTYTHINIYICIYIYICM